MPQIGEFTRDATGYSGRIQTLTLDLEITITPVEPSEVENAPDYRLHHGAEDSAREIGAAWMRSGEKAGEYLAVLIDEPSRHEERTAVWRSSRPMARTPGHQSSGGWSKRACTTS